MFLLTATSGSQPFTAGDRELGLLVIITGLKFLKNDEEIVMFFSLRINIFITWRCSPPSPPMGSSWLAQNPPMRALWYLQLVSEGWQGNCCFSNCYYRLQFHWIFVWQLFISIKCFQCYSCPIPLLRKLKSRNFFEYTITPVFRVHADGHQLVSVQLTHIASVLLLYL